MSDKIKTIECDWGKALLLFIKTFIHNIKGVDLDIAIADAKVKAVEDKIKDEKIKVKKDVVTAATSIKAVK